MSSDEFAQRYRREGMGDDANYFDAKQVGRYNQIQSRGYRPRGMRITAMQPDPRVVDRMIQTVVASVQPLRIILFGSAARGEMGPDSDLDVLVVMPNGTHRRKTAQQLYRQIRGLGVPFDIVVATSEDLEVHRSNPGLIYQTILREGTEVYVA